MIDKPHIVYNSKYHCWECSYKDGSLGIGGTPSNAYLNWTIKLVYNRLTKNPVYMDIGLSSEELWDICEE